MPTPSAALSSYRARRRVRAALSVFAAAGLAALVAACAPPSPLLRGNNPSGAVDSVTLTAGGVMVSGWAADANTQGPIDVMFWVDGKLRPERVTASAARPDVGAAVGRAASGYTVTLAVPTADTSTLVCVSALNVGPGASSLLGCRTAVTPPVAPPVAPPTTAPPTTVPTPPPWLEVGATARVSVTSDGVQADGDLYDTYIPSISADGRYVAFASGAPNLVTGDTNRRSDVFLRDNVEGATTRVSVASDGTQANYGSNTPAISADGRYVAFVSAASNLVAGDTNGSSDVFVRDTVAGTTTRVSVATDGTQGNYSVNNNLAISADGRYVAFRSQASNLVAGDTNGSSDVFVRDTVAGTTTRVSVANDGTQGDSGVDGVSISADGRYVAFTSFASNLVAGDTNGNGDVFVRDTVAGTTTRVSVASDGTQGDVGSDTPAISADGRYVAFASGASNLVAGDTNGRGDVFLRDTVAGTTTRVSVASDGTQGDGGSATPAISADGRYVAFRSQASNLVAGDTNGRPDVFVRDTVAGTTTRVSVASDGTQGNSDSDTPAISGDGRYVAFTSFASNLVAADTNGSSDVFVHRYR